MTRNKEDIVSDIKTVLETYVEPYVAQHGGRVNFSDFVNSTVILEMSGACSGCSGSTATLKIGIKNLLTSMIPEVENVDGFDDQDSGVSPYMTNYLIDDDLPDGSNI